MKHSALVFCTGLAALSMAAPKAEAHDNGMYLGQIFVTAATFCPNSTAPTNGQLLNISDNSALYTLFGTAYGGDGRSTFALPDLRGAVPLGVGMAPGRAKVSLGQVVQLNSDPGGNSFGGVGLTVCIVTQGIFPSR